MARKRRRNRVGSSTGRDFVCDFELDLRVYKKDATGILTAYTAKARKFFGQHPLGASLGCNTDDNGRLYTILVDMLQVVAVCTMIIDAGYTICQDGHPVLLL